MTEHVDMGAFIAARSDQLNADDLLDGPRTITITKVTASPDAAEQPVSIHYQGDNGKPLKPCKTVRRILVGVWGRDASKYVGRSLTLYRDPTVAFGGLQVGGIRVSHMSDIGEEKTVALQVTRGRKAPFKIKPLKDAPKQEDAAEKWSSAYIGKLAGFTDLPAVESFEAEKSAKLAELETARPELHAKVAAALSARKAELVGSGFDDELTGAATNGDSPSAAKAAEIKAALDRAKDIAAVESAATEYEKHSAALDEEDRRQIEIAISQARKQFETAGAE